MPNQLSYQLNYGGYNTSDGCPEDNCPPPPTMPAYVEGPIGPAGANNSQQTVYLNTVTLAVTGDAQLAVGAPIGATPVRVLGITLGVPQDFGLKTNSFYYSGDGGTTARNPQAGDYLYANPSKIGFTFPAGRLIIIAYEYITTP